jgi:hypothetical protein
LKTKYSNEDGRFKIDERFVEDEFDEEEKASESAKPTTKEQLRSENLSSMKILEGITGKQLIRPRRSDANKESAKKPTAMNKIVRYDPSKNDHKMYELNDSSSDESSASSSSAPEYSSSDDDDDEGKGSVKKPKPEKAVEKKKLSETNNQNKKIEEDLSKFYKIEPNLKELFSSNDVFKFKFDNVEDKSEHDSNYFPVQPTTSLLASKSGKYSFLDEINFNNGRPSKKDKYFNSSESEAESSPSEDEDQDGEKKPEAQRAATLPRTTNNGRTLDVSRANVVTSFLPDFENDKNLKDALDYFQRKESVDQLKEEWVKSRELLVKVNIFFFFCICYH